MISDAFAYPLRGSGRLLLIIGAVLAVLLELGSRVPLVGVGVYILGLAYFIAFYFDIIVQTVSGEDEPPDFPDVSDLYGDIIAPLLRCIFALLISFLPYFLVRTLHDGDGGAPPAMLFLGLVFAAFYLPMAMLNVAVSSDAAEALPHRVLPEILRTMPQYLLLAGLLTVVFLVSGMIAPGLGIPFIGPLISSGVALYLSMVQARMAGVFYRERLEDLEEKKPAGDEEKDGKEATAAAPAPAAPALPVPPPPEPARVIPPPPPRT